MFDIGILELIILCIVALLVLGPERMPEAVRGLGLWLGRLRRNFNRIKSEIEREVGMDDVRRQLHNESILEEIRNLEHDMKGRGDEKSIGQQSPTEPAAEPQAGSGSDLATDEAVAGGKPDSPPQTPDIPGPNEADDSSGAGTATRDADSTRER